MVELNFCFVKSIHFKMSPNSNPCYIFMTSVILFLVYWLTFTGKMLYGSYGFNILTQILHITFSDVVSILYLITHHSFLVFTDGHDILDLPFPFLNNFSHPYPTFFSVCLILNVCMKFSMQSFRYPPVYWLILSHVFVQCFIFAVSHPIQS